MIEQTNESSGRPYGQLFDQMSALSRSAQHSARVILKALFERYTPQSDLDVGCGIGTWLCAAKELGVARLRGVDGPWLDTSRLLVDSDLVSIAHLENPLYLGNRFDLAICLETAEHLKEAAADTLVDSLVRHASAVLFSAAIPFQRGPGHVNEQWPNYWAEKFARHRYVALDFLRTSVWYDQLILWWYRQNVLLFVDFDWCRSQPKLNREGEIQALKPQPISVVLPDLFFTFAKRLQELEQALLRGGHFALEVDEHGSVALTPAPRETAGVSRSHLIVLGPPKRVGSSWKTD